MKKILVILFAIITPVVIFYFMGSAPNWEKEEYYLLKKYDTYSEKSKDTLSIMTYNIGYLSGMTNNRSIDRPEDLYAGNLKKAIDKLSKLQPDIIGLQEVDFEARRSYDYNQLDSVAGASNYLYAYQSVNWDKRYVPFPYWPVKFHFGKVVSGQGILAKYPISGVETERLIQPYNLSFLQKAFYIDRLIQKAEILINDKKIIILNVHFEAFDAQTRIDQAKRVKEIYENYVKDFPVLLIGDFNSQLPFDSTYSSEAMSVLMEAKDIAPSVSKSQYMSDPKAFFTFSSENPAYKIDHVFYTPSKIEIIKSRVISEMGTVSDHLPLMVEFKLIE